MPGALLLLWSHNQQTMEITWHDPRIYSDAQLVKSSAHAGEGCR